MFVNERFACSTLCAEAKSKVQPVQSAISGCNAGNAYYNYRYFLPYPPEWGNAEFCNTRLRELLGFCHDAQIDAVQFFVNTLPGTYYMPAHNANEQLHWAAWMKETVAPALREKGISYQLNFQMLLGAHSSGLDMRDEYDWEFLVNHNGQEALGCACPIGPKFRKAMGEMLRLWASTGPDIIWIDDDFRMHNHGLGNGELDFYCYCDTHLERFNLFSGKRYLREELVAKILSSGKPSPVRNQWLDFLGETMTETASWIRKQVQGVSPQTRLAIMTSAPDVHSAEGRDWKKFLTALSGDYPPITRPCSGVYNGTTVPIKNQTVTYRFMAQSIAAVENALGPGVAEYGPELENTRFTTWSKSVRNTEFVLLLSQLLGCSQITLSMSDLEGSPISDEPTNLAVLRDNKPRLQTLTELKLGNWRPEGLVFLNDPKAACKVQLTKSPKMQDLGLLRQWEDGLLQMGIPGFYATPGQAADSENVVVLEGYTAWCPDDSELEKILVGRVLLDAEAAFVLQERGFGCHTGVNVIGPPNYGVHAEIFSGGILPDLNEIRVPNRTQKWYEIQTNGATVVSRFVDSQYRFYPGSTIFENKLGGRVAVYAATVNGDSSFANHARLRWLHGILRWLSKDGFCAIPIIPHHGMTLMKTFGSKTLLAFANLGTDRIEILDFRLKNVPINFNILDKSGEWQKAEVKTDNNGRGCICSIPCGLEVFEWLISIFE